MQSATTSSPHHQGIPRATTAAISGGTHHRSNRHCFMSPPSYRALTTPTFAQEHEPTGLSGSFQPVLLSPTKLLNTSPPAVRAGRMDRMRRLLSAIFGRHPPAASQTPLKRTPPPGATEEAKSKPNGWVYEIVGTFGPDDAVPPRQSKAHGRSMLTAKSSVISFRIQTSKRSPPPTHRRRADCY